MSLPIQEYRAPSRVLTACAATILRSTSQFVTRQRLSAECLYVAGGKEEIRHSGVGVPSRRGGPERVERRENSVVPMLSAQTRCSPTCTDLGRETSANDAPETQFQCHRAPTVIASRTTCGCEIGERGREDANQSVVHAIEDTRDLDGCLGSQAEGHGG
ncbi:hypothetical protein FB45DRAFT_898120 [Roridomyces roridus]|uniref:Uncharacterized protein n=1 Tax=Roridomyces roridus TaxID=1738132 RepID=A0AAD7CBT1_9AGAR|nr:hypothetical protein FB45DRAFT_898120 [Roridomyces roridus]